MPIGMTQITAFAVIILILTTGSLMSSNNALIEQVVKAQNMTANMTDLYLDNMSQFDDSGRISSREPLVKTDSCQAPHTQYLISGRIKVVMDDGAEEEFGPGDAAVIPPGHNAWVVGNEPVVGIDFTGLKEYAKSG
jgi:hypothetical protein